MADVGRITTEELQSEDQAIDLTLRPRTLAEYVGQEQIKENLKIALVASKKRREPMEHTLLYGNPGLGKTTLAHVIAHELGVGIRVTSGPAIERCLLLVTTPPKSATRADGARRDPS